jgi:hypothetical protein
MLAELAGLLATGAKPAAMSQGKSAEEDEKRLAVVLHGSDPVIFIDNCERPIEGDFLCSILTAEKVQARILGQSERRFLPCTSLIIATGNNVVMRGDVSRRALVCRIDAKEERPDAREFDFHPPLELLQRRPDFVVAALTALLAYRRAGNPVALTPIGSFPDYDWIRGTLVSCGYADPAETRQAIVDEDPRKTELVEIMDLWDRRFGDRWISVADISQDQGTGVEALRSAFAVATGRDGKWNPKSCGWWLRARKDRIVGARSFQTDGLGRWRLDGARSGDAM